jgi:arylformamidase
MEVTVTLGAHRYAVDMARPQDISVPVRFDGQSLTEFGAPAARREAFKTEGFIGDVKKGGSCNCDMLTFSPHLHGTHTECVGHITSAKISVHEVLKDSFIPATLVTVVPESAETYDPARRSSDVLITRAALEKALAGCDKHFLSALVVRTAPPPVGGRSGGGHSRDTLSVSQAGPHPNPPPVGEGTPPFFSIEAMQYMNELGVKHLLVDTPSIDRVDDEGKLTNHHLFWGLEPGSHTAKTPSPKTVTELISVAASIMDGNYMLALQLAPFVSDAAPSRPILYEVRKI